MDTRLTDESQVAEVNAQLGLPNEVGGVAYRIGDFAPYWLRSEVKRDFKVAKLEMDAMWERQDGR